ncbi:MAG TPA: hypothetical protein VHO29_11365 [Marmoricola sp.]|nr:hypothetical protein [Marmoricola sp.]
MATENQWTDWHGRAIADAAPEVIGPSSLELETIWIRLADEVGMVRPSRRRRLRAVLVGASAAIVLGLGGTAAAATLLSSHTGKGPIDQEDTALGGPGERLNPDGEDFAQTVIDESRDIPFPTEEARAISNETQTSELRSGQALVSVSALQGFTADDAICSWANKWASAVTAGDATSKRTAVATLMSASAWPAVTALDTKQAMGKTTLTDQTGTQHEAADNTRFGYLSLVQKAASGNDPNEMGAVLARNVRCIPDLVPDLPQAVPQDLRP